MLRAPLFAELAPLRQLVDRLPEAEANVTTNDNAISTPFTRFRDALIDLPVSEVWRGYGSALFLEFGNLRARRRRRDGTPGAAAGDMTLMIEWSWRIEKPRSILGGSWSSERRWPGMFEKLTPSRVVTARLIGTLPEIEVALSNGLRVVSFMTAEGQPAWSLISRAPPLGAIHVHRGRLQVERPSPFGKTPNEQRAR